MKTLENLEKLGRNLWKKIGMDIEQAPSSQRYKKGSFGFSKTSKVERSEANESSEQALRQVPDSAHFNSSTRTAREILHHFILGN